MRRVDHSYRALVSLEKDNLINVQALDIFLRAEFIRIFGDDMTAPMPEELDRLLKGRPNYKDRATIERERQLLFRIPEFNIENIIHERVRDLQKKSPNIEELGFVDTLKTAILEKFNLVSNSVKLFNINDLASMTNEDLNKERVRNFSEEERQLKSFKFDNLIEQCGTEYQKLMKEYSSLRDSRAFLEHEFRKTAVGTIKQGFDIQGDHSKYDRIAMGLGILGGALQLQDNEKRIEEYSRAIEAKEHEIKNVLRDYIYLKKVNSTLLNSEKTAFEQKIDDRIDIIKQYKKDLNNELQTRVKRLLAEQEEIKKTIVTIAHEIKDKGVSLAANKVKAKTLDRMQEKMKLRHDLLGLKIKLKEQQEIFYETQKKIDNFTENNDQYTNFSNYESTIVSLIRVNREKELLINQVKLSELQIDAMSKLDKVLNPQSYSNLIRFAQEYPVEMLTLKHEGNYLTKYLSDLGFEDSKQQNYNDLEGMLASSLQIKYSEIGINDRVSLKETTYPSLLLYFVSGGRINDDIIKRFSNQLLELKGINHKEDNHSRATIKALEFCAMLEPNKTEKIIKDTIYDQVGWFRKTLEFICKITAISKFSNFGSVEKRKEHQLEEISKEIRSNILQNSIGVKPGPWVDKLNKSKGSMEGRGR
jgi:hypothetical protein